MIYYDLGICLFKCEDMKCAIAMKLFRRTGKAKKKWRGRAWLVDPRKTKLTLMTSDSTVKPKHVPPWIYKLTCLQADIEDFGNNEIRPLFDKDEIEDIWQSARSSVSS